MRRTIACLAFAAVLLCAWTGSDPTISIVSPSGTTDSDVLAEPIRVVVQQVNTLQGVDYGTYWLVEDTDADSIVDAGEWTAATRIGLVDDVNRETSFGLIYLTTARGLTQGRWYFIVGCLRDLSGNTSCDTTQMPTETCKGGGPSGIADKAIARFRVQGYRP